MSQSDISNASAVAAPRAEKPSLRLLEIIPVDQGEDSFFLFRDRHGFAEDSILPQGFGPLLQLFDGSRTREQLIEDYAKRSGERLPDEFLDTIIDQMDERLLLDSPHFQQVRESMTAGFAAEKVRPAYLAGRSYPADPEALRDLLDGFFATGFELPIHSTQQDMQGSPPRPESRISRGCIVPHIDFTRGGPVEAMAYIPLLQEKFDTLVILGIAHSGVRYPFCLTVKDFDTPFGIAECDRDFCAALEKRIGPRLTAEQWAHKNEHSVEFVAVFQQYVEALSTAKIVPIICGGFFDEIRSGASPAANPDMAGFAKALREVCDEWAAQGKRVGFVVSVDGAHVGSQFGDDTQITPRTLEAIEGADVEFWSLVEEGDREGMHAHIARDNNRRNVDGHPALYALMLAFPEIRAEMIHYAQAYSEDANIVVTFASLSLYEEPARASDSTATA